MPKSASTGTSVKRRGYARSASFGVASPRMRTRVRLRRVLVMASPEGRTNRLSLRVWQARTLPRASRGLAPPSARSIPLRCRSENPSCNYRTDALSHPANIRRYRPQVQVHYFIARHKSRGFPSPNAIQCNPGPKVKSLSLAPNLQCQIS